ncbi:MAG: hypothetical protein KAX15_06850 [Candidatus Omnitrophica bacterium]|nr:hypothetical protein [Candidatus Omnitrophota bacterium]
MTDLVKKNKKRVKSNLPKEYLEKGGPGRPKGSKNKFTEIKEIIAQTFFDVKGKDKLKTLASKNDKGFRDLMKDIVYLMPKETKLTGEGMQINITQAQAKAVETANNRLQEQLAEN